MPEGGIVLNPGSGGAELDIWQDPATLRRVQSVRQRDDRGGVLFRASSGLIPLTATASLQVWGMSNPNASGKTAYIHRIFGWAFASAAAAVIPMQLQRSAAFTTGSAITAARPDNGTVNNVAIPRTLPTGAALTAGALGTLINPATASALVSGPLYEDDQMMLRDLILPPNSGIVLVAVGTPNAASRVIVDVTWEEV